MKVKLLIEGDLRIHLYYPEEAIKDGALKTEDLVLFVPGLPNTPNKNIAERFIQEGKACAMMYYYGSWYSGGKFSPSESRRSLVDTIEVLFRGTAMEAYSATTFKFTFERLSFVANSYGAQVVLTSNVDYSLISAIFLFAPFLSIHADDNTGELGRTLLDADLPFWRRGLNNVYRGIESTDWDDYFDGRDDGSRLKEYYPAMSIIIGSEDKVIPQKSIETFQSKYPANVEHIQGVGHDFLSLYDKYRES